MFYLGETFLSHCSYLQGPAAEDQSLADIRSSQTCCRMVAECQRSQGQGWENAVSPLGEGKKEGWKAKGVGQASKASQGWFISHRYRNIEIDSVGRASLKPR